VLRTSAPEATYSSPDTPVKGSVRDSSAAAKVEEMEVRPAIRENHLLPSEEEDTEPMKEKYCV